MSQQSREERLAAELASLSALKEASTLFDFEHTGDPPDRYTLIFRGKGISRDSSPTSDIETIELHRCDLRLPYSYPSRPPDIRWLTPIFHPNISFSGFIKLRDVGLPWEQDLSLDVVCERLWDVARLAYLNQDTATNFSAKNWYEEDEELQLPIDHRPLRDKQLPANANIVRYGRRGQQKTETPDETPAETPVVTAEEITPKASEVFYIGENTPTPPPRPIVAYLRDFATCRRDNPTTTTTFCTSTTNRSGVKLWSVFSRFYCSRLLSSCWW